MSSLTVGLLSRQMLGECKEKRHCRARLHGGQPIGSTISRWLQKILLTSKMRH
ncbi:MAG: hypothetical protein U0Y68_17005 [Blastocatellia bacterium]